MAEINGFSFFDDIAVLEFSSGGESSWVSSIFSLGNCLEVEIGADFVYETLEMILEIVCEIFSQLCKIIFVPNSFAAFKNTKNFTFLIKYCEI